MRILQVSDSGGQCQKIGSCTEAKEEHGKVIHERNILSPLPINQQDKIDVSCETAIVTTTNNNSPSASIYPSNIRSLPTTSFDDNSDRVSLPAEKSQSVNTLCELENPTQSLGKGENISTEDDEEDDPMEIPDSMRHQCVYDKKYSCPYCQSELSSKLSRHLQKVHPTEDEVIKILKETEKGSKERTSSWIALEKQGVFENNLKVFADKKGILQVMRRPKVGSVVNSKDYRICLSCHRYYVVRTIRVHLKNCSPNITYSLQDVKMFYQAMSTGADDEKFSYVLATMAQDNVTETVKSDELILLHGKNLYEGFNYKKETDVS